MPGSTNSAVAQVGFRSSSHPDKAAAAPALPVPRPCQTHQHKPACMAFLPPELCFPLGPRTQARTKATDAGFTPQTITSNPPQSCCTSSPQIPVILLPQEHKPLCCGNPHSLALFSMKEAGNRYSEHESRPDSHFHPGAVAALTTTPQPFPSHTTSIPTNKFWGPKFIP